jgi:hypothetical protein
MGIMVITGIIVTTAGAVVIVAETEGQAVVVALVIAEAVPAAETEGQVVAVVADKVVQIADKLARPLARSIEKTNILRDNQKIIQDVTTQKKQA